tara:strand:- start:81304 stop:82260 length:957 start_codon:yes stop_codon:yes gene_type:complete
MATSADEHSRQLLFPEISDRERKGKWWAARLLWLRRLYIGRKIQSLGMDSNIISYEGQRFRIYAGGEGNQPLVLLHGFLDTSHVFRRVLPELLKRFRVYMLDLPGHGESEMPFIRSLWHLPDISASIFRLLHHRLKLQDPILLSHSMGGLVGIHAQFFARKYHDLTLFQSMHLIAPGALLLSPEEREVLRRRFFPGTREEVQELFNHLFYSQIPELPGWAISGLLYEWSGPGFQYLAANTLERESEVFYKPTDLKKLDVPVELYWGKEDSITPLLLGKKLQKSIRGSKLHQFSPAGHGLLQEKPGEFLYRFLSRIHEL